MEIRNNPYRCNKRLDLAAILIVLAFFFSAVMTLGNYGISWDEGLGNLFFGNRYAQYITSGFDPIYLDFQADLGDQPGELSLEAYTPYRDQYYEFPGLVDTLSGLSTRFFAYKLGWLDPVDAFHMVTVLIASLYLWIQYYYVSRLFDQRIAIISIIFLAAAPRFWGDAHFNPKDVPEMAFFGSSLLSFMAWVQKQSYKQAILFGIFTGAALAVKANAVFLAPILFIWVLLWLKKPGVYPSHFIEVLNNWRQLIVMVLSAGLTYYLSWPLLYTSPSLVKLYYRYIFSQGGREGRGEWSLQPIKMILTGNSELFVIFLVIGVFALLMLHKRKGYFLLRWGMVLLWILIPILRISAPISVNFDGFRHFLEYLPAASLICAYGVIFVIEELRNKFPKAVASFVLFLGLAMVANTAYIYAKYAPFQYIYFNQFIGGSQGAEKVFKQGEVTDYWAISYRDGIAWINNNAGEKALLDVPIGDYLVSIPSKQWLREDIKLISDDQIEKYRGTDREVYIMNITRPSFYKDVAKSCDGQPAVYEKQVDGVTVMTIHHLRDCINQ